jgi:hypothetical protein
MEKNFKKGMKQSALNIIQFFEKELEAIKEPQEEAVKHQSYEDASRYKDLQRRIVLFRNILRDEFVDDKPPIIASDSMHYQQIVDNIFSKGHLWKHRTLRTVFDPFASEYDKTSMEEKLMILSRLLNSEHQLEDIIAGYKQFYTEQSKPHVARAVQSGLLALLLYKLKEEK